MGVGVGLEKKWEAAVCASGLWFEWNMTRVRTCVIGAKFYYMIRFMADYETSAVPITENLACILYVTFHVQSAGLEGHIRTNSDIGWHESTTTTNKKSWHGRLSLTCRHHLTGGRPRELGCTQRHEIMMYCFWLHRTRTALCEMKTNSGTAT